MEELAALFGDEVVVHITKDGKAITEDKDLDKVKELQVEQIHPENPMTVQLKGVHETGSRHIETVGG